MGQWSQVLEVTRGHSDTSVLSDPVPLFRFTSRSGREGWMDRAEAQRMEKEGWLEQSVPGRGGRGVCAYV